MLFCYWKETFLQLHSVSLSGECIKCMFITLYGRNLLFPYAEPKNPWQLSRRRARGKRQFHFFSFSPFLLSFLPQILIKFQLWFWHCCKMCTCIRFPRLLESIHLTWRAAGHQGVSRLGSMDSSILPLRTQVLPIFLLCGPQHVGRDPSQWEMASCTNSTAFGGRRGHVSSCMSLSARKPFLEDPSRCPLIPHWPGLGPLPLPEWITDKGNEFTMIGSDESRLTFAPRGRELDAWKATLGRQQTASATENLVVALAGIQPRKPGGLG